MTIGTYYMGLYAFIKEHDPGFPLTFEQYFEQEAPISYAEWKQFNEREKQIEESGIFKQEANRLKTENT